MKPHTSPFRAEGSAATVEISLGGIELSADIALPHASRALVIFAHGSGSSRLSPRNRHVADKLNRGAIGTILIDLLTAQEDAADLRFDIPLLGRRLTAITDWVCTQPDLKEMALGYFGASTGAAAALVSAADRPAMVKAVVSRGGRPDLAGAALHAVRAPTLFIVGENDTVVLDLNRSAMEKLPRQTERKLEIVPGASHLFEEHGALDRVAAMAGDWFRRHLTTAG